jgi:hypothetical protein
LPYSSYVVFDIATGEVLAKDSIPYSGPWELADRSVQHQANQAAQTSKNTAAGFGADAGVDRSAILPGLEREAAGNGGFSPTDLNNMTVASEQGAGGANSGITGQANLQAARTRNAGGFGAALDEAARDKTRTLSNNALGVQNENAHEKLKQQQFAQGQLGSMYGTDSNSMLRAMGLQNEDLDTSLKAGQSGWLQNFNATLQALTASAKNAAAAKNGGGGGGGDG